MNPIHLDEMGSVRLMNRTDTKYLCHIDQLGLILQDTLSDYRILEINGKRIMGYESLYYDTSDHEMYIKHHNRKLNRYKIRIRQYLDSGDFFLEVKFKNNKGRTKKKRITIDGIDAFHSEEAKTFIEQVCPYTPALVEPKLNTRFERITLVNEALKERITIDMNLDLHHPESSVKIPYLVIIEVKREKSSTTEGFGKILRDRRIFSKRISKYCLGTNMLFPALKHNRFRPKIFYIKKLDKTTQYDKLYSSIIWSPHTRSHFFSK